MGTLLYCGSGVPQNAPAIIRTLMNFGKPIVDFDPTDRHQALAKEISAWGKNKYYHSRFDEASAVAIALKSLKDRGHRVIGLPVYMSVDYYDWVSRRIALIEAAARRVTPEITLVKGEQNEKFWGIEQPFDPATHAESIHKVIDESPKPLPLLGISQQRTLRTLLLDNTPSIVSLLNTPGLSALIALNDPIAREIHLWLKYVGLRAPEDISIISFDNSLETYHIPISTIDFGFSPLAYRVAHLFINDIPIATPSNGDMPGICTVIDKGSIGEPAAARRPLHK